MLKQKNNIPMLLSLKELRDGRRYRQKAISIGTGLSEGMISRLLRDGDISHMTYGSAKALAKWLGVSTDELGTEIPDDEE
jgi:transcriptional regulator with XRE-family HTH domain